MTKWTHEEWILSLYIYLTRPSHDLNKSSPFLIEFTNKLNAYTKINRTPASFVMRISNYKSVDPKYVGSGLPNGGKSVQYYWDTYHDKDEYMSLMYEKIINQGIVQISTEAKAELFEIENIDYKNMSVEGKDAFIKSIITHRNGHIQAVFRGNLVKEFSCKCAICGINKKEFLLASHIMPYSKCSNKEDMINHYNGLLLCPNHDALFDGKYISFDDSGKIVISSKIPVEIYEMLNISDELMLHEKYMTEERKKFLKLHQSMMLKKMNDN